RGIDPNNTIYVLKLAAILIKELAGGEICGDIVDEYPLPVAPYPVTLSYANVNSLIGKEIDKDTVKSILGSLEIEIVKESDEELELLVPTYRVDVQRPCDVIEDILRVYGYNNIEFIDNVHSNLSYKSETDSKNDLQNLISEQLTAIGFNEILNNSLTALAYYSELESYPAGACVRLINPLSNDLSVMRQTLLFGGLESISHNVNRKSENLKMYEFGNCYKFNDEADNSEKILAPYSENGSLALWITGNKVDGNWTEATTKSTVFDLKSMVINIFARLGISSNDIISTPISNDIYSSALAFTTRGGKNIGTMGVVKRTILKMMDIDQEVYYSEINWNAIVKLALKRKVTYTDLPKTQPVKRDLALLIDSDVTFAEIEKVIRDSERKLLKNVSLFDVYEGKNLEAGKKSYAVSVILQDEEKTLQDKQIEATMSKIIGNLEKQVGAKLR
ncbi:MAG: phenylalanine--tRNA ligase subunit beta, partial [Muribaculaceae bacterium]